MARFLIGRWSAKDLLQWESAIYHSIKLGFEGQVAEKLLNGIYCTYLMYTLKNVVKKAPFTSAHTPFAIGSETEFAKCFSYKRHFFLSFYPGSHIRCHPAANAYIHTFGQKPFWRCLLLLKTFINFDKHTKHTVILQNWIIEKGPCLDFVFSIARDS